MSKKEVLSAFIQKHSGEQLEVSKRGSGLNAVWKVQIDGKTVILKTYDSRRKPLQTFLSNIGHVFGGRTPYTASARHTTEIENLKSWKDNGFDVPEILDIKFDHGIPLRHTFMEYIEGTLLSSFIISPETSDEKKESVFIKFVKQWGERHRTAEKLNNPRWIQEHASFDHVMISGDRLVTLDLEVSYTNTWDIKSLIASEICGYMRSILKKLPNDQSEYFLKLLISNYPYRPYLEAVYTELFDNPSPAKRLCHHLDRTIMRPDKKMSKFEVAKKLNDILSSSTAK